MTRIPYAGTTVPPEKTQAEIQRLLYDHGAKAVQWSSAGVDRVQLRFIIEEDGTPFTIRIEPPLLTVRKRTSGRRGSVQKMVDLAASMRLVKWWLKTKLEAVEYGLVSAREEFLASVAGRLEDGTEVTIGQLIIPRLGQMPASDLTKMLPSGES